MGHAAGSAPLGADWGDTAVVFPDEVGSLAAAQTPWLEDGISGNRHGLQAGTLPLAEVLTACPVAVLSGKLAAGD